MKVKLEVIESSCRSGYHKKGDSFLVKEICPPICQELWHIIYPNLFVLQNGGSLDYGDSKAKRFRVKCPDNERVVIEGYIVE